MLRRCLFVVLLALASPVCAGSQSSAQASFTVSVRVTPASPDRDKLTVQCTPSTCQVHDATPVEHPSYTLTSRPVCTAPQPCVAHVTVAY